MTMYDPERVVMQAASTEKDPSTIKALVLDALNMAHAEETMTIGTAEFAFGWTFHQISVARSAIKRLGSLPDSYILKVKGDSVEQKFVNWLNGQAKKKGFDGQIHFTLTADLRSSRYGLF
jgi:hypothetical protein